MSSFTNLLSRLNVLSEAKISPMDKILPGFQTQARSLASSKGASSGTREGRLAMLAILFDLDIIDESIVRMFKNSSVSRMVDYFETNGISKKIRERSDDIGEHISNQLENKVSFTTGNRTDSAQQRYEVNKLNAELKANKKTARIEKKKETASAMADISQTVDKYDDLLGSLEASYSDKYMIEIVASIDSELEDIAKIVGYMSRFTDDKEIDVDGRSIDIVFTSASKLGRIIQKMGIDTVERNIAHDLKKYGGAGVVIHEPDADSSKDLIGFLRKSAPEDEEMEDYEEEYSTDEAEETTGGKDNAFEEFVKAYRKVNPSPIDSAYDSAYLKTLEKTLNESSNGGRPLNINSTSKYLTEQLRRDSCRNITQKKTVSFREKYNPKTQWQLEELRRYGM